MTRLAQARVADQISAQCMDPVYNCTLKILFSDDLNHKNQKGYYLTFLLTYQSGEIHFVVIEVVQMVDIG